MQRRRVANVVNGSWGTATVFNFDEQKERRTTNSIKSIIFKPSNLPVISSSLLPTKSSPEEICLTKQDITRQNSTKESLSLLLSSLFSTILEDAILEMRILEHCNNELKVVTLDYDRKRLKDLKYGVIPPPTLDELEGIDADNLDSMKYKVLKMNADRKYITNVLECTFTELATIRTFKNLKDTLKVLVERNTYQYNLEIETAQNRTLCRELFRQLRQQRIQIKSVTYDTNVKIDELQRQNENALMQSETGLRYVSNWEGARTEQNLQIIDEKEFEPINSINFYKQKCEHEHRVHSEVELLVNIVINETLTKVEQWMEKYDHDIENLDLKIQLNKNAYQDMVFKRIEMENTLKKHEELIKDWIKFKDEREKARIYHETMTNAAIAVQAWWRGLLVRCQLGPFKPKKKTKKSHK